MFLLDQCAAFANSLNISAPLRNSKLSLSRLLTPSLTSLFLLDNFSLLFLSLATGKVPEEHWV